MHRCSLCLLLLSLTTLSEAAAPPKSRTFFLTYAVTVSGLEPGQRASIWLPVPLTSPEQQSETIKIEAPIRLRLEQEPRFGNRMYFGEPAADAGGKLVLRVTYRVTRREIRGGQKSDIKPELFLKADAKVPIEGKPLTLLKDQELPAEPMHLARALYDIVYAYMRYSKEGTGWGQGDVAWVCDSRYGNCSDFHSLFISLARSQGLPARFEIGYPLPDKRGEGEIAGYHCWAWFKPARRDWVPVDISEASKTPALKDYYFGNLTENRVAFSMGRDLILAPPQAGPPLNFFIHPYVEVAGRPYPSDKVMTSVTYQDLKD